jgi:hypothetical protein
MNIDTYQAIGPDSPLGDREGAEQDWTAETVKEISEEEVKNPHDVPGRTPEPKGKPKHQPERDVEESERKD